MSTHPTTGEKQTHTFEHPTRQTSTEQGISHTAVDATLHGYDLSSQPPDFQRESTPLSPDTARDIALTSRRDLYALMAGKSPSEDSRVPIAREFFRETLLVPKQKLDDMAEELPLLSSYLPPQKSIVDTANWEKRTFTATSVHKSSKRVQRNTFMWLTDVEL